MVQMLTRVCQCRKVATCSRHLVLKITSRCVSLKSASLVCWSKENVIK